MAYINTVESEGIQVGKALTPPIASIDVWPSLDPTTPFSVQNYGISNFIGAHNQLGIHNGLGASVFTGLSSLLGFKTGVGGQANAEPKNESSAPQFSLNSPDGRLTQHWTYNGTPLDFLHTHSDVRLKKNITPLSSSLDKILCLNPVSFDWNKDISSYVGLYRINDIGLIAQEVEKIVPEVVSETDLFDVDFKVKNVDYTRIVPLLIGSIQEQQKQIEDLRGTVQELSEKLAQRGCGC